MNRIKIGYWIVLLLVFSLSITFIILNNFNKWIGSETSNLFVALFSFCVSILSLGLATMKKPEFEGKVTGWLANYNKSTKEFQFNFGIDNHSQEPIKDFVISLKVPKSYVNVKSEHGLQFESFCFGDTNILSLTRLKYFLRTGVLQLKPFSTLSNGIMKEFMIL